jgi:phosphatidylserine/phosphatidylglycerophosphate/cardiolipin synthase-like enzyme
MPKALAFSNNDIAVFAWSYEEALKGCLGFALYRGDANAGTWAPLPALARFESTPVDAKLTTEQAPVQKFWWKDLGARRGGMYRYRIVPLGGEPGALKPLAGVEPLVTNVVSITHDRGLFQVYFNRGIVATQALTHALGTPSAPRLLRHIADPKDAIRQALSGEIQSALELLLDRADASDGEIRGALYELNDPQGLEVALHGSNKQAAKRRAIVLGNSRESKGKGADRQDIPDADAANRKALKAAGAAVVDRILPSGRIPHNKFLVLKEGGAPTTVLTGSTNWTTTGLCTQTNNALIIRSPAVAAQYADYWDQLEKDSAAGNGADGWQGEDFRTWVREHNERSIATPTQVEDNSATVSVAFAPSTSKLLNAKNPEVPGDVQHLFDLIAGAKQAVLFLAFDPGNHSILDAAGKALAANPRLFVRGALTSPQRALNFKDALGGGEGDEGGDSDDGENVAVIGEPAHDAKTKGEPDYRAIPAGAVSKSDAFGAWEAELRSAGHAIIHDKIVVIDPFSPDCVVVTGSHNLGYRASSNNDENLVIVRGHRSLAEAYACHVLDVYDHYAFRYWLAKQPEKFGRPLEADDGWQARYLKDGKPTSAEMQFWLSAVPSVVAHEASPEAGPKDGAAKASHATSHASAHAAPHVTGHSTHTTAHSATHSASHTKRGERG